MKKSPPLPARPSPRRPRRHARANRTIAATMTAAAATATAAILPLPSSPPPPPVACAISFSFASVCSFERAALSRRSRDPRRPLPTPPPPPSPPPCPAPSRLIFSRRPPRPRSSPPAWPFPSPAARRGGCDRDSPARSTRAPVRAQKSPLPLIALVAERPHETHFARLRDDLEHGRGVGGDGVERAIWREHRALPLIFKSGSTPLPMTSTSSVAHRMRSTQSVSEGMPYTFPSSPTAPPPHLYLPRTRGR